jgi:hypothetical protein
MSTKQWLIGCGVAALILSVVGFVGCSVWVWHVSQDPEDVNVYLDVPSAVSVGEEFTLIVVVENDRADRGFELGSIDIADEYFDSFVLVAVDPDPRTSSHIPIDNTRSFVFDEDIPPGGEARYAFTLRAPRAGIIRGDIDVCEGQRFLSVMVQTEVRRTRRGA